MSVIIASYNRHEALVRLLEQLSTQTVDPSRFEVIVVDDGSREDVASKIAGMRVPFALRAERQENQGAATARHRGAGLARGDVILFLDDDMQGHSELLAAHLAVHDRDRRAVVLGRIRPDPSMSLSLFERFHARVLERFADDVRDGRTRFRGVNVWTGNLSLRRTAYFAVGGFDSTLGHSEDAELGVRLEKAGARFVVSEEAYCIHSSDHSSLDGWMRRAYRYGIFDRRISRKHSDVTDANPWRYFAIVNPVSRPFLASAIVAPRLAQRAARVVMSIALGVDRVGLERAALAGTTLAYGMEYARGLRDESGGLVPSLRGYADYAEQAGKSRSTAAIALARMASDIAADHATMRHYQAKYRGADAEDGSIAGDGVRKIGFQMMIAYRAMRFAIDAGLPLAPRVLSRAMRHLYGSDVHWEARFAPGVMIVHGMGLAISDAARVGKNVILFQNVTLGVATHPDTHASGAPVIEDDVHIGPGAAILGPITIGARSKIMANCVVRRSVPPDSLVMAPDPIVEPRTRARTTARPRDRGDEPAPSASRGERE